MGFRASLFAKLAREGYTHITSLNSTHSVSFLSDEVRQSLGHRPCTLGKVLTEACARDPSREYYNDRAANKDCVSRREPRFGTMSGLDMVKSSVTNEDSQRYLDSNSSLVGIRSVASLTAVERGAISRKVRRLRLQQFNHTVTPEGRNNSPSGHQTVSTLHSNPSSSVPESIDPALLDEETLHSFNVDQEELNSLQSTLFVMNNPKSLSDPKAPSTSNESCSTSSDFANAATDTDEVGEEAERLLLGPRDETNDDRKPLTAEEWIDSYARISVVKNLQLARKWNDFSIKHQPFESTVGQHSLRGNSRDDPTPFVFYCNKTNGCTYRTIQISLLEQHQSSCNEGLVKAATQSLDPPGSGKTLLKCAEEGCTFDTTAGQYALGRHEYNTHAYVPKPCNQGCDPTKIYYNRVALAQHNIKVHSSRWPTGCLYPSCVSEKLYHTQPTLVNHLKKDHGVDDAQQRVQYLPARLTKMEWTTRTCIFDGCSNQTPRKING